VRRRALLPLPTLSALAIVLVGAVPTTSGGASRPARGGSAAAEAAPGGPCGAALDRALALIREAERAGDVASAQKAIEVLRGAERACPDEIEIPFWRGIACIFARDYPAGSDALQRVRKLALERLLHQNRPAAEVDLNSYVLFLEAAIHQYVGGRPDLALEKIGRLKSRQPDFMPDRVSLVKYYAHVAFGSLEARRNEMPNAVRQTRLGVLEATRQMAVAPGQPGPVQRRDMANRNLAEIYRLADRWVESQQLYEQLAQMYPQDGVIHYGLATVYADQQMFVRAAETWRKAVALIDRGSVTDPRDLATVTDAKMRLGISLVHASGASPAFKAEEGMAVLRAYAEAHPDDSRVWLYLGYLAMDVLEDFPKARQWLEKAREMDPWCEDTLRHLVKLYTLFLPDEARRAAADAALADPAQVAARKKEMDRRKATRADATNGCR
jgi:tetratricopeptide (TPR) repeat protein